MNFKVGQKVRITGDRSDFTNHLDGKIGTIVEVMERDCLVDVHGYKSRVQPFGYWFIWNYNMEVVEDDK